MSFGSSGSSNISFPVSGGWRGDVFNWGERSINNALNDTNTPTYNPVTYTDPGAAQTLNGGDYDRLEQSLLAARTGALDQAWENRQKDMNQEAAGRGLWSSGIPLAAQSQEFSQQWLPQYNQAANEATTQRYNLQSGEDAMLNQYNLNAAQARNAFNADQNNQAYNAAWRPYDYWLGLYNQTGGAVSSGGSSGYNFSI